MLGGSHGIHDGACLALSSCCRIGPADLKVNILWRTGNIADRIYIVAGEVLLQQLEDAHRVFQSRVRGWSLGVGILPRILSRRGILAILHFTKQSVIELKPGINNESSVGILCYVLHIVITRIPLHVIEDVV